MSKFIEDKVREFKAAADAGDDNKLKALLNEVIRENDASVETTLADMTKAANQMRGQ